MLSEAFDRPLSYKRNKAEESDLKNLLPSSVTYYEIYDATLESDVIRFYLFLVGGDHYELHFSNSANDYDPMPVFGGKYKNNQLTRIIATGMDIAINKLKEKTTPFLIYGSDKRKTDLFKKAILSKMSDILIKDVKNIKGLDGSSHPTGFYVKQDTRTLKIEQMIQNILKANK